MAVPRGAVRKRLIVCTQPVPRANLDWVLGSSKPIGVLFYTLISHIILVLQGYQSSSAQDEGGVDSNLVV